MQYAVSTLCLCTQDAWFCKEFPQGKDALVFGVLDGHGVNGGVLSQTLSKLLPDMLTNCDAWKVSSCSQYCSMESPGRLKAMLVHSDMHEAACQVFLKVTTQPQEWQKRLHNSSAVA